jgi:hypothetical protein
MNWQSAAIYGAAAVIAVHGLLALMTAHRRHSLRRFLEEESRRRQSEPAAVDDGQNSKAA